MCLGWVFSSTGPFWDYIQLYIMVIYWTLICKGTVRVSLGILWQGRPFWGEGSTKGKKWGYSVGRAINQYDWRYGIYCIVGIPLRSTEIWLCTAPGLFETGNMVSWWVWWVCKSTYIFTLLDNIYKIVTTYGILRPCPDIYSF